MDRVPDLQAALEALCEGIRDGEFSEVIRDRQAVEMNVERVAWVRPAFVVRNNEFVAAEQAGAFRPGDYAYFLVQRRFGLG